jgi:hypothetical protein
MTEDTSLAFARFGVGVVMLTLAVILACSCLWADEPSYRGLTMEEWREAHEPKSRPLKFTRKKPEHGEYLLVEGDGEDVAAFVVRYQDALFPAWRANDPYAAMVNEAIAGAKKSGKAMVWAGSDLAKRAITTASVDLPIPGIDE